MDHEKRGWESPVAPRPLCWLPFEPEHSVRTRRHRQRSNRLSWTGCEPEPREAGDFPSTGRHASKGGERLATSTVPSDLNATAPTTVKSTLLDRMRTRASRSRRFSVNRKTCVEGWGTTCDIHGSFRSERDGTDNGQIDSLGQDANQSLAKQAIFRQQEDMRRRVGNDLRHPRFLQPLHNRKCRVLMNSLDIPQEDSVATNRFGPTSTYQSLPDSVEVGCDQGTLCL